MAVYSPERVNRLRMVLGIVVAIAALTAVFAAFILADRRATAAQGCCAMVGGRAAARVRGLRVQAAP